MYRVIFILALINQVSSFNDYKKYIGYSLDSPTVDRFVRYRKNLLHIRAPLPTAHVVYKFLVRYKNGGIIEYNNRDGNLHYKDDEIARIEVYYTWKGEPSGKTIFYNVGRESETTAYPPQIYYYITDNPLAVLILNEFQSEPVKKIDFEIRYKNGAIEKLLDYGKTYVILDRKISKIIVKYYVKESESNLLVIGNETIYRESTPKIIDVDEISPLFNGMDLVLSWIPAFYSDSTYHICRLDWSNSQTPGSIAANNRLCNTTHDGVQFNGFGDNLAQTRLKIGSKNYGIEWKQFSYMDLPRNPVLGGVTHEGIPVYIARKKIGEHTVYGKVVNFVAYYIYNMREHESRDYQILVINNDRFY